MAFLFFFDILWTFVQVEMSITFLGEEFIFSWKRGFMTNCFCSSLFFGKILLAFFILLEREGKLNWTVFVTSVMLVCFNAFLHFLWVIFFPFEVLLLFFWIYIKGFHVAFASIAYFSIFLLLNFFFLDSVFFSIWQLVFNNWFSAYSFL